MRAETRERLFDRSFVRLFRMSRGTALGCLVVLCVVITSLALLSLSPGLGWAGVQVPHEFKNGEKADAVEVNECFGAIAAAVNENDARIAASEAEVAEMAEFGFSPPRFVDNGDGTVTDKLTRLMWQKNTANFDGSGGITEDDKTIWVEAAKYCRSLEFAGHTDWYLPSFSELHSIVDETRDDPMIHPIFTAVGDSYWASTPFASTDSGAWVVVFTTGMVDGNMDTALGSAYIRAVRWAQ